MAAFKAAALRPYDRGCLACGNLLGIDWHAHHVVTQQHIRRAGGDVWDPRNAMRVCASCHDAHHNRSRPISGLKVPVEAAEFAIELLGRDRAEAYFERYYDCELPQRRWIGY
jgi:5-methylcytosine-specific restriction endonuclease McrA